LKVGVVDAQEILEESSSSDFWREERALACPSTCPDEINPERMHQKTLELKQRWGSLQTKGGNAKNTLSWAWQA